MSMISQPDRSSLAWSIVTLKSDWRISYSADSQWYTKVSPHGISRWLTLYTHIKVHELVPIGKDPCSVHVPDGTHRCRGITDGFEYRYKTPLRAKSTVINMSNEARAVAVAFMSATQIGKSRRSFRNSHVVVVPRPIMKGESPAPHMHTHAYTWV